MKVKIVFTVEVPDTARRSILVRRQLFGRATHGQCQDVLSQLAEAAVDREIQELKAEHDRRVKHYMNEIRGWRK